MYNKSEVGNQADLELSMLWPNELDDESLYSLFSRLSRINSLSPDHLPIQEQKSLNPRAADIDLDFSFFASSTNETYGSRAALIQKYVPKYENKNADSYSLIGLSNRHRHIWRWCESCAAEEVKQVGIAYWHKLNQHPCVLACEKHHIPLMEVNLPFRERQNRFLLPRDGLIKHAYPACDLSLIETALSISRIHRSFMADSIEFELSAIAGLITSEIEHPRVQERFLHAVKCMSNHNKMLETQISNLANNYDWDYLPLVIYSHFENFDFFVNAYKWHLTINLGTYISKDEIYIDTQTKFRKICTDYVHLNPSATRSDLWMSHPQCMRWLNKYDKNWINELLPCINRSKSIKESAQIPLLLV